MAYFPPQHRGRQMLEQFEDDPTAEPTVREDDMFARGVRLWKARFIGTPGSLWEMQTRHERKRIFQRCSANLGGQDTRCSLAEDADNNIRACWVEQGIWKAEWGPPWPPKPAGEPRLVWTRPRNTPHPQPRGDWRPPQPAAPINQETAPDTVIDRAYSSSSAQHKQEPVHLPEATLPSNEDHTRPRNQFLYQVGRERSWIEEDPRIAPGDGSQPLDTGDLAYERVKKRWQKDGLWRSQWGLVPGETWVHEEPDDETENDPAYVAYARWQDHLESIYAPPPTSTGDGGGGTAAQSSPNSEPANIAGSGKKVNFNSDTQIIPDDQQREVSPARDRPLFIGTTAAEERADASLLDPYRFFHFGKATAEERANAVSPAPDRPFRFGTSAAEESEDASWPAPDRPFRFGRIATEERADAVSPARNRPFRFGTTATKERADAGLLAYNGPLRFGRTTAEERADAGLLAYNGPLRFGRTTAEERADDILPAYEERADAGLPAYEERADASLPAYEERAGAGLLARNRSFRFGTTAAEERADAGLPAYNGPLRFGTTAAEERADAVSPARDTISPFGRTAAEERADAGSPARDSIFPFGTTVAEERADATIRKPESGKRKRAQATAEPDEEHQHSKTKLRRQQQGAEPIHLDVQDAVRPIPEPKASPGKKVRRSSRNKPLTTCALETSGLRRSQRLKDRQQQLEGVETQSRPRGEVGTLHLSTKSAKGQTFKRKKRGRK